MAVLYLLPPQGGRAVTRDDIRTALAERGVVAEPTGRCCAARSRRACAIGLEIATDAPRCPARRLATESLLAPRKPLVAEDESGRIDLRDLGSLLLVNPGTPLMRRIPARQGTDGADGVFGKTVAAVPAADPPFAQGLTGVAA
ncbi:flagellar assembly protein A [Cupriavidus basilensis]